MAVSKLYRRRFIPSECILLKDDVIVEQNEEILVTAWDLLHPRSDFARGCSCYFLREGFKISKMYQQDNSLRYYYCDIIEASFQQEEEALTVTDLLADVIIYPDGQIRVVDLDELAEALERKLITQEQMSSCLRRLDHLLSILYRSEFDRLLSPLNRLGL